MNAVEIADAVADLAAKPFEAAEFPFQFLAAFDKKETQLKRLRKGDTNRSDVPGGVLLQSNIHLAVCATGETHATLGLLKASTNTTKAKAKFILSTDGQTLEAEELSTGEAIASEFPKFAEHIGFFLPLAGISTVREIKDNPIDVRATGRLNKLYVELLRQNPEWGTDARRHDMNRFMARLIFCFFAEDTDIFDDRGFFTTTIEQFTESDGSNTHLVIQELFRAMNVDYEARPSAGLPSYATAFKYVNGGLFAGSSEVPQFTRIARSYLLQTGSLDWKHINPDIFGSMIQAVADEAERGALGMHYTSVPNILKVLNPLFLDELRVQLEAAGDNPRTLLNLRKRLSRIRVFDPACGSGNFLVIAYKELRKIEAEINTRRGEHTRGTEISKKNFRGIEIRDFAAEIARLALVIAEYQCDVLHRGSLAAKAAFLPLDEMNWIVCGNALRLDWLEVCPPESTQVRIREEGKLRFGGSDSKEIDFQNDGREMFICGNPPFSGTRKQTDEQKDDLSVVFATHSSNWGNADYVGGWLVKAAEYDSSHPCHFAFVATNSLCQGQQIPLIWTVVEKLNCSIRFAHTSFIWSNLARHKAGVTVIVVGLDSRSGGERILFDEEQKRTVSHINPYLTEHPVSIVPACRQPLSGQIAMDYGVYYSKSAGLLLSLAEKDRLINEGLPKRFVRRFLGSTEFLNGLERYCLWLKDQDVAEASRIVSVKERLEQVRADRTNTEDKSVQKLAARPHQFRERKGDSSRKVFVPIVSSENRHFFPAGIVDQDTVPTNKAFFIEDAPLWCLAIICSSVHLAWVATICGRLRTDFSYSNTLGWNTFPVPPLTEQDKADLNRCAEGILLAREAHFPATIADLYDPEAMPENLRAAHDRNDETLERIYIGRRFKNDTERLETLFAMYAKMTAGAGAGTKGTDSTPRGRKKKEVQA
jgi:hypothetical protein